VQSGTTPGMAYTVELGLKGNPKTFKSLVNNCTCKDFLKRGPGCKHVGAVLIGLAARAEPPGPALMLEAEARARAALARPGEVPRRVRLELGDTPRGEAAGSAFEPPARRAGVQAFASVKEKAERLRDAEQQRTPVNGHSRRRRKARPPLVSSVRLCSELRAWVRSWSSSTVSRPRRGPSR